MAIFDGLSKADAEKVQREGRRVRLPAGWSPIAERTPADKAYIILSGEVSVRRGKDEIARIGPGEMIGEAGIVSHKLRNASVVALTQLEALHYTSEQVEQLRREVPAFKDALERQAAARLGTPGD